MDIGIVLQTTPPALRVIELAKRAESLGFSHVWTFDSHILWEEPYVIYITILNGTAGKHDTHLSPDRPSRANSLSFSKL